MKITKKSPLTGKENTMEINVTNEQLSEWKAGNLIQKVMPNLTADEREFIMTGFTPEDFKLLENDN